MVTEIQSRSTLYDGTWFRSRLEATWAAYFNAHDIEWEYEERAFRFDDGTYYAPDFWLPESRAWFEVKGRISDSDRAKILNLAAAAGKRDELVIMGGSPAGALFGEVTEAGELNLGVSFVRCAYCDSWTISMAICRQCGHVDLERGTFIDECKPGSGCRSRCIGGCVYVADQIVKIDGGNLGTNIAAISGGFKIINRGRI